MFTENITVKTVRSDVDRHPQNTISPDLNTLVETGYSCGAGSVKIISSKDIMVDNNLTAFCNPDFCKNYGHSPGCPPHVAGPPVFRQWQEVSQYALVVQIPVPAAALFSHERIEYMRLLHETVACLEQEAAAMGYKGAKAFAGGSCKEIFCRDRVDCRVLSQGKKCLYPQQARPSMSGFGINVSELMKTCGWPFEIKTGRAEPDAMSWIAGIVLF